MAAVRGLLCSAFRHTKQLPSFCEWTRNMHTPSNIGALPIDGSRRRTGLLFGSPFVHTSRLLSPFLVHQRREYASKLKKVKPKAYSSYKGRFKLLANGVIKRWRSGKRHNAHSKTNKQQRQLRRPSVVSPGLAVTMKKLGFGL